MTERRLPIPACAALCGNAMNEVCIEECSPKRDCSSFELRPDLNLPTMPSYPETRNLTWKERFVIEEAYLKKTIDFIQGRNGVKDEHFPVFSQRTVPHPERYSVSTEDRKTEGH